MHDHLGPTIREFRRRRRQPVHEVAARLGLGPAVLYRIETGRQQPTPEQLAGLAAALEAPELLAAACAACPVTRAAG